MNKDEFNILKQETDYFFTWYLYQHGTHVFTEVFHLVLNGIALNGGAFSTQLLWKTHSVLESSHSNFVLFRP